MSLKIYLACTADVSKAKYSRRDYERLKGYAARDQIKRFNLTDDPNTADLILFVGSSEVNFSDIRQSNLYLKHHRKSAVFISGDRQIPLLPGLYPCLEKGVFSTLSLSRRSSYYLRVTDNESLDIDREIEDANYLFSFRGSCENHPIRAKIAQLEHPRAHISDISSSFSNKVETKNIDYIELLANSKFVLCPRGIGVSSWRLFETMRAGRVPVIISDGWLEPDGPDWSNCSLRISEADVDKIAEILIQNEHRAALLAKNARSEWERYYAPHVVFDTIASHANNCLIADKQKKWFETFEIYLNYLNPFFTRHWVISPLKTSMKSKVSSFIHK